MTPKIFTDVIYLLNKYLYSTNIYLVGDTVQLIGDAVCTNLILILVEGTDSK